MSPFALACVLSLATGFLSLSQEILFVRLLGFAFYSTPEAFAFVLTSFLAGIAIGAAIGKRVCASGHDLVTSAAIVLLAASALDALVPRLAATIVSSLYAPLQFAVLIAATAALKSVLFPIAHQLGASPQAARLGRSVSRVYASNIAGSTLGPLVTGFWLLDVVGLENAFLLVAAGTLLLGVVVLLHRPIGAAVWTAAAGAAIVFAIAASLPVELMPRIAARDLRDGARLTSLVEGRSGVVHTVSDGRGGDIVYGGNVYDGRTNTSLVVNSNGIDRVYLLRMLHPSPRRVLVIGMSTGAWTKVLATFPDVDRIDVVEINPTYVDLVAGHPQLRTLLEDPRVSVHVDDGRRWLVRRPDARYDLVVMNTTYHWRAYATNLLSREFLGVVRSRLDPGGVFVFNPTQSPEALHTAAGVFPFVRTFQGAAYCAEHDPASRLDRDVGRLYALRDGERSVLDAARPADREAVQRLAAAKLGHWNDGQRHWGRPIGIVTDDNMLTEYRYGRRGQLMPQLF